VLKLLRNLLLNDRKRVCLRLLDEFRKFNCRLRPDGFTVKICPIGLWLQGDSHKQPHSMTYSADTLNKSPNAE